MSEIDRMIASMNKRIKDAETKNQQMERRIKELEGQTNSLGIIEPGQEDFLVGGMILISDAVSVNSEAPNEQGTNNFTKRQGIEDGDDIEDWLIAKLPQPTLSFRSFIAQVRGNSEVTFPPDNIGAGAAVVCEIYGIQEDFKIDDVTFAVADAFDIKRIGTFNVVSDVLVGVVEGGDLILRASFNGVGGFIDAGAPGSTPDEGKKYFGILFKTFILNIISTGTFTIFGSVPAGSNSLGFYSPNTLLS